MSLACRAADWVNCGLAATGPHPLAARVALISLSTTPPWSPPSAWAGTAASIGQRTATAAAQTVISVEAFPLFITRPHIGLEWQSRPVTVWTQPVPTIRLFGI